MNWIAIKLINLYQRWISPYKGYKCAHAYYHKGTSCSQAVKDIVVVEGVIKGWVAIQLRFSECKQAYQQLNKDNENPVKKEKNKPCEHADICFCFPFDFFS